MFFQTISFSEVKTTIEVFFHHSITNEWSPQIKNIHKLALEAGINLKWASISEWNAFEYGEVDLSERLIKLLFESIKPLSSPIIIVTDECFSQEKAFVVDLIEIENFIINDYPKMFRMDFFQPSDYLFIFPTQNQLIMLHHDGFITKLQSLAANNPQ